MKTIIRAAAVWIVAALATVACGATDGAEQRQTEQATESCIPIGGSCIPSPTDTCCQTYAEILQHRSRHGSRRRHL